MLETQLELLFTPIILIALLITSLVDIVAPQT